MADLVHPAVHAQNTLADYSVAQKVLFNRRLRRSVWLWTLPAFGLAAVTWFLVAFFLTAFGKIDEAISILVAMGLALCVYLRAVPYFSRFRLKGQLHPHGPFLTATDLTVAPEGLFLRSERGEGRVAWQAILKIEETATHIYFFFDHAMAQVIPKRSFASGQAASDFVSTARRYFSAAHTENTSR